MSGTSLTRKILDAHLASDQTVSGTAAFTIDSVLFHDMSGILGLMAYDDMKRSRAGVPMPVVFTDHNLTGSSPQTAMDQAFVRSCARAFGLRYSKAGNGICHALYAERIARPGLLMIGADSHSQSCGALGMLGIGMGGMEVAAAMTGRPFPLRIPKVIQVCLEGRLAPGVTAMDAGLTLLSRLSVKGALGACLEYTGSCETLSVPQRMTLCNLGAEMGATASLFPADRQVLAFLRSQNREADFKALSADPDALYDSKVTLDLGSIVPMVALPSRPDTAVPVTQAGKVPFSQIFIGSCANGSYEAVASAARALSGQRIHQQVQLLVSCQSRSTLLKLMHDGHIEALLSAGARLLECSCGPCMGIGQAPESGTNTLRTTNRNFPGRSGTKDAGIYLASPLTAASSALAGHLCDPRSVFSAEALEPVPMPEAMPVDDSLFLPFDQQWDGTQKPLYTDQIRPIPSAEPLPDCLRLPVSLKAGDGISTDDIVPADSKALTLRANIPALSEYLFRNLDPGFAARARALKQSCIVAGEDYAQGSSREHAAAGCLQLGVRAVIVLSMHRIHRSNLINYGIVPLFLEHPDSLSRISPGDVLLIRDLRRGLETGHLSLLNETTGEQLPCRSDLSDHERALILSGGLLRYFSGDAP